MNPNLWRAKPESRHSCKTSSSVISTTVAAKRNVMMRAISSPLRRREINEREPAEGLAPGTVAVEVATVVLLNGPDGFQLFSHNFLRKLCVLEFFSIFLPVRDRPLQKVLHFIALRGVRELCGNQQPSETGDWVSLLAGCVRDRDAKVIRHSLGGSSRRFANARKIRLQESSRRVFHGPESDVVFCGVDQFHIADGIRRLLDQTGYAFVALATKSHGPANGRTLAYLALPLIADLGKIVCEDIGRTAAVRAVY